MTAGPRGLTARAFWVGVGVVLVGQAVVVWALRRPPGVTSGAAHVAHAIPTPVDPALEARAAPWSSRPLDVAGEALARDLGRSPNDLRLFADGQGRVSDGARRDLLVGREVARRLSGDLELQGAEDVPLVQIALGYMIRRVTEREIFRGKPVTPAAIDDAVRNDALKAAAATFGPKGRDALAAALPALPDLTGDLAP